MKKASKKMSYSGTKKMMAGGAKKMMTGGMKNANASVSVETTPSTKGVTPNMNPSANVVPGGQPSRLYGGKMKRGGTMKKMGKKK
jgi:hypothetical protein